MKKNVFIFFSLFFFFFFLVFSYFVAKGFLSKVDFDFTVKIQNYTPKSIDLPLSTLSLVGSFEITFIILIAFLFLVKKKVWSLIVIFLFFFGHVFEFAGKVFIHHAGPPFLFFRYDIPFLFPTSYVNTGFSYPSGHSFRAVFLTSIAIFLAFKHFKKYPVKNIVVFLLLLIFLLFVLISRISLGEHWISDVIGGMLLGISFSYFSFYFFKNKK